VKLKRQTENATNIDGMDRTVNGMNIESIDLSEDIAKAPVEFVLVIAMVALPGNKRHDLTRVDSHHD